MIKTAMFGQTYEASKPVQVPTFLQYCKSASKAVEGKTRFSIEIVWLPGKFNNVTLQTHAFRFICDESHPLYKGIQQYFESSDSSGSTARLDIVIDSLEERTITVHQNARKKGCWEKLGTTGMKFKE